MKTNFLSQSIYVFQSNPIQSNLNRHIGLNIQYIKGHQKPTIDKKSAAQYKHEYITPGTGMKQWTLNDVDWTTMKKIISGMDQKFLQSRRENQ